MNKRKQVLDIIKIYNRKTGENEITEIFTCPENYYQIHDLEYNTNLSDIFKLLYTSPQELTLENIAEQAFADISTINRYAKKFNTLAIKLIGRNKNLFIKINSEIEKRNFKLKV